MTRIGIVEDHPLFGSALRQAMIAERFTVAFVAASLADARVSLVAQDVDVVLLDVLLPDGNGLELAAESATNERTGPSFVVLTSLDDAAVIAEAERAGCRGFVSKVATPGHIAAMVREVARGGRAFDVSPRIGGAAAESPLSPRELSVLALVAEGMTNGEIAHVLGITAETVKTHVSVVREKLGAADRAQAVAIGVRRGLV